MDHVFRPKKRLACRDIAAHHFLTFSELQYLDGDTTRTWEVVQRKQQGHPQPANSSSSNGGTIAIPEPTPPPPAGGPRIDAVDLVVLLSRSSTAVDGDDDQRDTAVAASPVEMLVVVQYRPPLDAFCIEFPAGMVDLGETPIAAALRELREETGFVASQADCIDMSDILAYEPGLTNSCFHLVTIQVDLTRKENQAPKQQLDDGEDIAVHRVPHHGALLMESLTALQQRMRDSGARCIMDGKLFTYALGLKAMTR